jgi:tripartite-type tricarboxylate transporter receptor subunit TctC
VKRSICVVSVLLILSFFMGVSSTLAQPYPNHPVQLVNSGAAGSILDIAARIFGDELGRIVGAQMIPVARPGAGFTLGTDSVVSGEKGDILDLLTLMPCCDRRSFPATE